MNHATLRAHARRDHLSDEIRRIRDEIREREREVGVRLVTEGGPATDDQLDELRARRQEILDELRLLDVGVEFARHSHP